MLPVNPQPEPPHIHQSVAIKGLNILLELTGQPAAPRKGRARPVVASDISLIPLKVLTQKSNSIWTRALPDLRVRYSNTCAYVGVRIIDIAHVDHFKPKSKHQHLAYNWSNFRLASPMVNGFKKEHEDILDPFCVESGWFELDLLTGKVDAGRHLTDPGLIQSIRDTIKRLKLNEYQPYVDLRLEYINRYINSMDPIASMAVPAINFAALSIDFPYVAAEIDRQGKKRP